MQNTHIIGKCIHRDYPRKSLYYGVVVATDTNEHLVCSVPCHMAADAIRLGHEIRQTWMVQHWFKSGVDTALLEHQLYGERH